MRTIPLMMALLTFALCIGVAGEARAQEQTPEPADDPTPLLFFGRGLYTLDEASGQVAQWTDCGDGFGWRIDPTGTWVARLQDTVNVRLCNLRTSETVDVIAPEDTGTDPFPSLPSWSPDGSQVAWSVDNEDGAHILYVYDMVTEKVSAVVDDLPPSDWRPQVLWGESGILVVCDSSDTTRIAAPLYDPSGELLMEDLSNGVFFTSYFWVTDADGKAYLGRYANFWQGDIVDPETGIGYLAEDIELYGLLAPDGLTIRLDRESGKTVAHLPDGETVIINDLTVNLSDFIPFYQFDPHNIAIAPDGEAFAIFWLDQFVWRDGEITEVPDTIPAADGTGVVWGPMGYRVLGGLLSPIG